MPSESEPVLILSTKVDEATDEVVGLLKADGVPVVRIDTEDFPFDLHLTSTRAPAGELTGGRVRPLHGSTEQIRKVRAVWYRRVRIPERPPSLDSGVYDFVLREARAALLGCVLGRDVRIMSPPDRVWAAENKLYQLRVATEVGLTIPETVVTNDPNEVRVAFRRFGGSMIAKPVRTGYVQSSGGEFAIYTSRVSEADLTADEELRLSPVIYQREIPKECDLRVTIVGGHQFAVEIHSQSRAESAVDWRRAADSDLPHRRTALPRRVAHQLAALLDALGLRFGAVDLIRTFDGQYVFLEVNPSGQWLWLDDQLDLGITAAVARWLACGGER